MNMHLREGRSHVREFVEVPGGFRRSVEDAIEGLLAVLDQLDGDPDLEDDGSAEPTLGWPNQRIPTEFTAEFTADGELEESDPPEEDDPDEDNGDDEDENSDDSNLTVPETSGGFICVANDNAEELALRERFDPRLAQRPTREALRLTGWNFSIPRFPQDAPDRPRFYLDDEIQRLTEQAESL
jgi:hypothetical protein